MDRGRRSEGSGGGRLELPRTGICRYAPPRPPTVSRRFARDNRQSFSVEDRRPGVVLPEQSGGSATRDGDLRRPNLRAPSDARRRPRRRRLHRRGATRPPSRAGIARSGVLGGGPGAGEELRRGRGMRRRTLLVALAGLAVVVAAGVVVAWPRLIPIAPKRPGRIPAAGRGPAERLPNPSQASPK